MQQIPRCQVVPQPNQAVSFQVEGQERLAWHFGTNHARPFFYPLLGPAGRSLTRIGHPGAPDHDHHLSIWFAHHKVAGGVNFWGMSSPAVVRQSRWLAYHDSDEAALMAVELHWLDGHDPKPLLKQELVARVSPTGGGETLLELQATFTPQAESLEFGQTNFGFLAVRVARSLSATFGGGKLSDSEGRVGEPAIFGQTATWMDYSGPIANDQTEGITFFDHPENPDHPTHWHVRSDGWMGASACFAKARTITKTEPLVLRYLLHAHAGAYDANRAQAVFQEFAALPGFVVKKGGIPHEAWGIQRKG